MTWPVRSKRLGLYGGAPTANVFVSLGTVPSGKTWLVKDWSAYNSAGAGRNVFLMVKVSGVTYVVDYVNGLVNTSVAGNSNRHIVLNAGEEIGFQSSTNAANLYVQVSGAQLG